MKLGLTGKIWLALGIMISGFLLIIGLAWNNSNNVGKRLETLKAGYLPALTASAEANSHIKQLLERYNHGVIIGDPDAFPPPEEDPDLSEIHENLSVIANNAAMPDSQKTEAKHLRLAINEFAADARPKYRLLSQGEEPVGEIGPERMAVYAERQMQLKRRLTKLEQVIKSRFEHELSAINSELQNQQRLGAILFLLVSLISVIAAYYVINRNVKEPVQLLAMAANAIADGKFSQRLSIRSNDEIGDLGHAFNKMAQNLEETLVGLQNEVKERTRAENALIANEENLRITLNSIGEAVIATDRDGIILRCNPVACNVTGCDHDDMQGKPIGDVLHLIDSKHGDPVTDPVKRILQGETTSRLERLTLITDSGEKKQIAETSAPMLNSDGDTVGVVLVFRDITDQLARDEQLNQSRKMDSIGQLAGGVAHDFNNMLGAIMGAAEVMRQQIVEDVHLNELITMILAAAERAGDLTQKLLTFSRKGKVVAVELDIHNVIVEAMALLERSIDKRITLVFERGAGESIISGDRSQIQNAILNLGINARDAISDGGTITFRTESVCLDQPACDTSEFEVYPGNYVKVCVKDTGVGISPDIQAQIFEPFFTTKDVGKGTGLGLAAVYGCIKEHQGAITLSSQLGQGTEFCLLIPVLDKPTRKDTDTSNEIKKGKGCILLVEDEELMRKSEAILLKGLGYKVLTADDGKHALEVYEQNKGSIDLVILDMLMPRMNGLDCYRELRKIKPDIQVVIASGFAEAETIDTIKEEGAAGFIQKPFTLVEISNTISYCISPEGGVNA